jgi:ABC-type dipeptide/oligopeptide/nickel transport system permease component
MATFLLRRILQAVPVLLGVAIIAFLLTKASGDPVRRLLGSHATPATVKRVQAYYGFDKPWHQQFGAYLLHLAQGDLGASISKDGTAVTGIILDGLAVTLKITLGAFVLAVSLGLTLGVLSAWKPNSWIDYGSALLASLGISFPAFFLGMLLLLGFAVNWRLFPIGGYVEGSLRHLILPCITLGCISTASIARLTRTCLLETQSSDYVRSARAKGRGEWRVLLGHTFPNALVPVVTVIGGDFAGLLTGAVLTETVFNIPGIGTVMADAIFQRDLPVVMGCCLIFGVIFVFFNLVVDVLYAFLDPRIRHA